MRRGTFALIILGVTAFLVWFGAPGKTDHTRVTNVTRIAAPGNRVIHEPVTYENLSVFMISGNETVAGADYSTLQEALGDGSVIVHETGNVNELLVENEATNRTVVILAGSIVKGGQQDRVLCTDMVLRPNSGKVPIAAFCVEQSRWEQRGTERVDRFASSKFQVSGKGLRKAVKNRTGQHHVWQEVASEQSKLNSNIDTNVTANASPSSFQLAVENETLEKDIAEYKRELDVAFNRYPDAIGYAICINGEFSTADVYANRELFRKAWDQHLSSAITEAISLRDQAKQGSSVDLSWRDGIFAEQTYQSRFTKQTGGDNANVIDQNEEFFRYNSVVPSSTSESDEQVSLHMSYESREE